MKRSGLLGVLVLVLTAAPVLAEGPYFEYLGHQDLGDGNYRHDYVAHHTDNPFVSIEATDFHVDGQFAWDPGTVTVESPQGWVGEYDGAGPVFDHPPERTMVGELMVCSFLRSDVQGIAVPGEAVELFVWGRMTDGHPFTGADHLRVIDEGEPHVSEDDPSTILDDAIRGPVATLGQLGDGDLGPVTCLPGYLSNYEFTLNTDPHMPQPGEAVFYLYRFCGGTPTCSYGRTSADTERTASSGDCP